MIARKLQPGEKLWGPDSRTPYRAVGLIAFLGLGYVLFSILWPMRWSLLATWAVIESIYYVFYYKPRFEELNQQPDVHRPSNSNAQRGMVLFRRFLQFCRELPQGVDYEQYLSGWFNGAPFSSIKRGNVAEFMAYGFFYRSLEEMRADPALTDLPDQMVRQLETCWGIKFQEGHNPSLKFMGHLWETLKANYRPLVFYISTEVIGRLARLLLRRWGFKQGTMDGLAYFTLNLQRHRPRLAAGVKAAAPGLPPIPGGPFAAAAVAAAGLPPLRGGPFAAASAAAAAAAAIDVSAVARSSSQISVSSAGVAAALTHPSLGSGLPADVAGNALAAPQRLSSLGKALSRSKSSPFEAGPPDWAPFITPADPSVASVAGRTSSSGTSNLGSEASPSPAGSSAGEQLAGWTSSGFNPLQGALSEQLGSRDTPVLFLHGVGGLPGYLEMMSHVMALGHPVIAVEFRGVSMRWGKVYTADEVVASIIKILDHLNVKEVCLVGHSYGTFIAGALSRLHRTRVHNVCLIDPVCFGMFMPHLLYNFLYKFPEWDGRPIHFIKEAARRIASSDMHVAATFSRGFFWSELNLWPEDLPVGSVVLLSGKDDLMNSMEVKDMLEVAGHVKVIYNHKLTHGAFLFQPEVKATIVQEVRTMLARSGSALVHAARPLLERTLTMARTALAPALALAPKVNLRSSVTGSQYVEDYTNRLVRTFTGNLASMMSITTSTPTHSSNTTHPMAPNPAPVGIVTQNRALLQTFSGPAIRRRLKGGWGAVAATSGTQVAPVALVTPMGSQRAVGGSGSPPKSGSRQGGAAGRPVAQELCNSGVAGASKEAVMNGIMEEEQL